MPVALNDAEQQTLDTKTASIPDSRKFFTEFGVRMAAVALDLFIAAYIVHLVETHVIEPGGLSLTDHRPFVLALLFIYFTLFWSSQLRATPAQLLLGMRVVDETGEKISFVRALLRSAILIGLIVATFSLFKSGSNPYIVAIALVSYGLLFLAALTPNRQAAHDLLAHSLVVNRIALKSPQHLDQLRGHVRDSDTAPGKQRRPSIIRIVGNLLLLGVPVLALLTAGQVANEKDLRYRIGYAIGEVADLKTAVNLYYVEHTRWPSNESELGVATKAHYPDGGYYELEDDGVIRIRFTVKPELKKGSIILFPGVGNEKFVWQCRSEGGFEQQYLGPWCRE